MEYEKLTREIAEAGRFKHDQNLHDRQVIVQAGLEEIEIIGVEIDGLGNICILVEEMGDQ